MENLNHQLYTQLTRKTDVILISWGGTQKWLFFVFVIFLFKAVWVLWRQPTVRAVYVGDSLLAPLGVLLKKIFHKPVVIIACGLDITWPFPPYQFLIPRCLKSLDRVVSISPETREQCLRRGIPPEKVVFIPIGITNPAPLSPSERALARTRLSFVDVRDRKILLTVGRLVKRKGVQAFIRNALPQLAARRKDILYLVVGEGPERVRIEAAVDEMNLRGHVMLVGRVDDRVLRAAYAAADIFVMPNIRVADDMEGFGIVALEAAAAGLPVVAADMEGIRAAVQDGANGVLVAHDDYSRYVDVILDLLANDTAGRDFGAKAQVFVQEHYAWDKIVDQYLALTTEKTPA